MENISLRDVADELGLRVETRTDNRIDYFCPIHDQETGDLSLYPESHFACHKKGGESPVTLLMHCKGFTFEEAKEWMAEKFPEKWGSEKIDKEHIERKQKVQEVLDKAVELSQGQLTEKQEQSICEKRNLEHNDILKHKVGYFNQKVVETLKERYSKQVLKNSGLFSYNENGLYPFLKDRIVIPYLKFDKVRYLIGRKTKESKDAKYKKLKQTEYNEHILWTYEKPKKNCLVITEGIYDAISVAKAGYPVCSPVTTQFSKKQVDKVVNYAKNFEEVYIAMDGDEAGQEGQEKTAILLANKEVTVNLVSLSEGMDFDDWTTENGYEIEEMLQDSQNYLQTLLEKHEKAGWEEQDKIEKEKIFPVIKDWSKGKRSKFFKEMDGSKRDLKDSFKEWKKEHEPKNKEKKTKELNKEFETGEVGQKINIKGYEILINPTNHLRINSLKKTVTNPVSGKNGVVKTDTLFKIYEFQLGEGEEETKYTLLTPPSKALNPGDKFLPIKNADIGKKPYKKYFKRKYKESEANSWEYYKEKVEYKTFEIAGDIDQESQEVVKNLSNQELRELVEGYLDYGFEKDEKIKQIFYPKIVRHDKRICDPGEVMPSNPHTLIFTNTKVGKSYTAKYIGQRRDDVTPAGLIGFVSAEDGRKKGILDEGEENFFLDEINQGSSKKQVNDSLLSLLELGSVTQSKAGEDLQTNFYGSLSYMANPQDQNKNVDLVERFQDLVETLGYNIQAMGSRFGIILFNESLEVAKGNSIGRNRGKKLESLVNWIKKEVAKEYTKIARKNSNWLQKEFSESYKNFIRKQTKGIFSDMVEKFWLNHLDSYRHARGQALRQAVYNNLSDVLSGDYSLKKLKKEAEECFRDIEELNMDSLSNMLAKVRDSEGIKERYQAMVKDQKPKYLRLFVKTVIAYGNQNKEKLEQFEPVSVFKPVFQKEKKEWNVSKGSKYWKWSKIQEKISKNNSGVWSKLSNRYGLRVRFQEDVLMVKASNPRKFEKFREVLPDQEGDGDQSDQSDRQNSEKSDFVCGSSEEIKGEKEEHTHTKQKKSENHRSHQSHRSPEKDEKDKIDLRKVKKEKEIVLEKVEELDDGNGISYMSLLEKVGPENRLENIIDECMGDGSLYEPTPGKVKVL